MPRVEQLPDHRHARVSGRVYMSTGVGCWGRGPRNGNGINNKRKFEGRYCAIAALRSRSHLGCFWKAAARLGCLASSLYLPAVVIACFRL